ncbi:MAG: tetratricopeptide repeat protein [Microcoleus sp. SIO2G3]|nr:tetratricopeptide repeat protein [Microcoleus sp. SIO2G3]
MRRKACIFLVFTIMLVAAQSVFAAPTRLGKIVLVTPKNKTVQMKRNGKWIKAFEGSDLYKDDFLKPQSGATVKILCTTSVTNFFPTRVPEEIPSSVNSFCSQRQVSLLTQREPTDGSISEQSSQQETVQNGAATDGSVVNQSAQDRSIQVSSSERPRRRYISLTQKEAIASLEALITEGSQAAFVYRQLGNLYQQTKQPDKAKARYSKAVELATTAKDVEEKAAAQVGLGELYAARGNVNQAVRYLKDAQTGYQSLGNRQQANTIKQRIEQVTR